jgi:cytoplasmic iron level regulating protein YaaA (DUF328/UPF0246 family)
MQILISCAKIMTGTASRAIPFATEPTFQVYANENAMRLSSYSVAELQDMLHVNHEIAMDNWHRFQNFHVMDHRQPAIFSYDGMVFLKLVPETFSDGELLYANDHLLISSFLYGLLRPLDLVNPYRLEGNVVLSCHDGKSMFDYWKPVLTEWFIEKIKADDGVLVNLASDEMRNMFDWKRVKREVTIVTPDFKVEKGGKLKTIVIYTKMCRGAMTRFILKNRLTEVCGLGDFEFEGFALDRSVGEWTFTLR